MNRLYNSRLKKTEFKLFGGLRYGKLDFKKQDEIYFTGYKYI